MVPAYTSELHTRAMTLAGSLRQIRGETDRVGAADVIHQLRNAYLTAHGALSLAEKRLSQGRYEEVDGLLDLAEKRLRECRALVERIQRRRYGSYHTTLRAA